MNEQEKSICELSSCKHYCRDLGICNLIEKECDVHTECILGKLGINDYDE